MKGVMKDALIHDTAGGMPRLLEIMRRLRDPETGCPWDIEQSFETIAPYTIEEAYEVADAIERGSMEDLRGELGDLLLQVVFHAQIADDRGLFAFDDVANAIAVKAALESLAAKTLAERGLDGETDAALCRSIAVTQAMLEGDAPVTEHFETYHEANVLFHETIMRACGNDLIAHAFERIAMLPFAALGALSFEATDPRRERMRLTVGHSQHVIILDALRKRDAGRAEAMMREHSHATMNYGELFSRDLGRAE